MMLWSYVADINGFIQYYSVAVTKRQLHKVEACLKSSIEMKVGMNNYINMPRDLIINTALTHWDWVTHMCVTNLAIICSENGLSPSWSTPSHYLNQYWQMVDWTLKKKTSRRNSCIFTQQNPFQNVVWKMAAILSGPHCINNMAILYISASVKEAQGMAVLSPWNQKDMCM